MSSLAELLPFEDPPTSWFTSHPNFTRGCLTFLWNGLTSDTRKTYKAAKTSYNLFCKLHDLGAFPATTKSLAEWITWRANGSGGKRLKPSTIQIYLSAVRSKHVDRGLPTDVFDSDFLRRLQTGIKRLRPVQLKQQAEPLTSDLVERLASIPLDNNASSFVDDPNFKTANCVAFAGFLRSGEFMYDSMTEL